VSRALLVILVCLVVAIGVGVGVSWTTGRVPLSGCRIRSVDKDKYVAGNRAILDALPVFPGATRISTNSSSWSVARNRCLPTENSGPYDTYKTTDIFTLPQSGRPFVPVSWYEVDKFGNRIPAHAPVALAYLDATLRENGWRGGGIGGCCSNAYENGTAALFLMVTYDGAGQYEVGVVHDTATRTRGAG
jgi:hypothetical protein